MSGRVTIKEAAEKLGCSQLTIQYALRENLLPFGTAFKREGSTRWTYLIYRKKFEEYVGEM